MKAVERAGGQTGGGEKGVDLTGRLPRKILALGRNEEIWVMRFARRSGAPAGLLSWVKSFVPMISRITSGSATEASHPEASEAI